MTNRPNDSQEREVKEALEVLKSVNVPPFQPIPIEQIIPSFRVAKPVATPVFAFISVLAVLTCAALFAIPMINKPSHRKVEGIPASCLIQSVTGGNVEVRASKQSLETQPAHAGLFLEEGSKIKTGEGSEAILRAGSEVNLAISENSELEMTSLRIIGENLEKDYLLKLNEGRIYCDVNSEEKSISLNIITPDAAIQVWGTEFEVIAKPKMGTHIGVFEGDVLITPAHGMEPFHVLGGFQTLVTDKKGLRAPAVKPLNVNSYRASTSGLKNLSPGHASENSDGILSIEDTAADGLAHIEQIFEDKNVSQ